MTTRPEIPLLANKAWKLIADNVDYIAEVTSVHAVEFFLHNDNATPPADDVKGHKLSKDDAINLEGILWARAAKENQPATVVVTK